MRCLLLLVALYACCNVVLAQDSTGKPYIPPIGTEKEPTVEPVVDANTVQDKTAETVKADVVTEPVPEPTTDAAMAEQAKESTGKDAKNVHVGEPTATGGKTKLQAGKVVPPPQRVPPKAVIGGANRNNRFGGNNNMFPRRIILGGADLNGANRNRQFNRFPHMNNRRNCGPFGCAPNVGFFHRGAPRMFRQPSYGFPLGFEQGNFGMSGNQGRPMFGVHPMHFGGMNGGMVGPAMWPGHRGMGPDYRVGFGNGGFESDFGGMFGDSLPFGRGPVVLPPVHVMSNM